MVDKIEESLGLESRKFLECYEWLERSMPPVFFEDVTEEQKMIIVHHLMGLNYQSYFSLINLAGMAVALSVEEPGADLHILEHFRDYGIKSYQAYVSSEEIPFGKGKLRIGLIRFTELSLEKKTGKPELSDLKIQVRKRNPEMTDQEFDQLISSLDPSYLKGLPSERVVLALEMYLRAKTRDHCQYDVIYNEDWEKTGSPSLQIVMAWRNTPKYNFLYAIARVIFRHHLVLRDMHATYVDPDSKQNVLVMILGIHGQNEKAAWDVADLSDFLRELVRVKFFTSFDMIEEELVNPGILSGNFGSLIRGFVQLTHQFLLHINPNFYTPEMIEEAFCHQPEMTAKLCACFDAKFHPEKRSLERFAVLKKELIQEINQLDTGNENYDALRKNVLLQSIRFIQFIVKTNFYRRNLTALSFRIDPRFMEELPYDSQKIFPEQPFGIFFMTGLNFFGFHVRFKDLARGGLRTVNIQNRDQYKTERNQVFNECYNLAYTQHKKNKEIPEGGSKGIIFLKHLDRQDPEITILKKELELSGLETAELEKKIEIYRNQSRVEQLHAAQRAYIESLITIVNCDTTGVLKAKQVVDYLNHPEYIYIGPDENMSNEVIEWIAAYSKRMDYAPKGAFITSKPKYGINHKQYGVTSLGVATYMEAMLRFVGMDPDTEPFKVKLSGGPDGDVAGNMLVKLYEKFPKTAKIVGLTDVSGTIQDLEGLDLKTLVDLFHEGKSIRFYPYEKLNEGGFLVDSMTKKIPSPYVQKILCVRKKQGQIVEDWLSGSEANFILRQNMHSIDSDIFVTAGGRPKTLNDNNWKTFLDETGKPTAKIIVEGANLYLSPGARTQLEERGVLIVKDSSANKCGVICSSFEVLAGLALGDELFLDHKETIVAEILEKLKEAAENEANLLIDTFAETNIPMTEISNEISDRINRYKYEILDSLMNIPFPKDENHPLVKIFFRYCLPILRENYKKKLLTEIPENHKKAIISAYIASQTVYKKGLNWSPSVVDILPLILQEIVY